MSKFDRLGGWIGPELLKTGDHLLTLDSKTVSRLSRELPSEFSPPTTTATMQTFRSLVTDLLGDLATDLIERVASGLGLAIVRGEGLEQLVDGQLTALVYSLSLLVGRPMPQNHAGDLIVSVRDEHPADPNNARGYISNDRMLMHSDASDVSSLLCLNSSACGGSSILVNSTAVHDVLVDENPQLMHEYYRLWIWNLRGLQRPDASPTLLSPIFSCYGGKLSCHYVSSMIREGASQLGERLSTEQVAALDHFEAVCQRPELVLKHTLRRGESIWMNNHRVLHGRDSFVDGEHSDQTRHLLRMWIWLHQPPRLAAGFASLDLAIFGDDRLGHSLLNTSMSSK